VTQKGDHAQTMEIIDQLRERKIPFQAWTSIYCDNRHDLRGFFDHALAIGADTLVLNKMIFLGNGMKLPKEYFLTSDQIGDVLNEVLSMLHEYRARGLEILIQPTWGPIFTPFERKLFRWAKAFSKRHYCPGGRQLFGVNPKNNGVYSCCYTVNLDPLKIGALDARKGIVLTEEWPFRIDKIGEPCRSCDILETCGGGCRGTSMCEHLLATGELDFYAGFANCSVALGVTVPGSLRGAIHSFASFVKHRGIMPHPPK